MPITRDIADQLKPKIIERLKRDGWPVYEGSTFEELVSATVERAVEALINHRSWAERPWLTDEQIEEINDDR